MKKTKKLINNINIKIPKNSFVSIVGPSGSEDNLTWSLIMLIIRPDRGNIFLKSKYTHDQRKLDEKYKFMITKS